VFVALVMQHAMRRRHIILSYVSCPAVQYFSTLSHKFTISEKKKQRMCLDFLWTFVWNFSHYKKKSTR